MEDPVGDVDEDDDLCFDDEEAKEQGWEFPKEIVSVRLLSLSDGMI